MVPNLYIHFPFCRRKCTYCALHSHAGSTDGYREQYVSRLCDSLVQTFRQSEIPPPPLSTIYFGGGSPALCDLRPLFKTLRAVSTIPTAADPDISPFEFSVELHPLDVTRETLQRLKDGGVNRISMGVQSLDDGVLKQMGRGYTFAEAERAFSLVKNYFDNAGIDLIVGYPGDKGFDASSQGLARLTDWGLTHCSVYSLILEERSILFHQLQRGLSPEPPGDDEVLDCLHAVSIFLDRIGLERYEISNYAVPGYECRHNLATWRGEDYLGLGEGACGREGLKRTRGVRDPNGAIGYEHETVTEEQDAKERLIFRLRTRDGLDTRDHAEWVPILDAFAKEGLLSRNGKTYRLTERGTEVCDTILAELV